MLTRFIKTPDIRFLFVGRSFAIEIVEIDIELTAAVTVSINGAAGVCTIVRSFVTKSRKFFWNAIQNSRPAADGTTGVTCAISASDAASATSSTHNDLAVPDRCARSVAIVRTRSGINPKWIAARRRRGMT